MTPAIPNDYVSAPKKTIIYGTDINKNSIPPVSVDDIIIIPGANGERLGISKNVLSKHMLFIGGTGTGKTNLFYHTVTQIKRILTPNDVMIIFDTKGDFESRFYDKTKDYIIGNSFAYKSRSRRWSIEKEISINGPDFVIQNATEICKSLFAEKIDKNSSNPFFPIAASDLLASIMAAHIKSGFRFQNEELKEYLDHSTKDDIINLLDKFPTFTSVKEYINGKNSQSQGVLSEVYSTARDVLMGVFAENGDFSIREFIRKKGGRTLFLEYDLSVGEVLGPVYSLLMDLALKEAMSRTKKNEGNVYFIMDELKLLPHLRHLENGINFGRSLGVKVLAGLQSIDQLNANYSNPASARNITSGFSTVFAFRPNDYETRKYVKELFGENCGFEQYPILAGQIQYEKLNGNAVEDWDITGLGLGESIVGMPFGVPFRFKSMDYDEAVRKGIYG